MRFFDILFSSLGLIIFSPLLIIIFIFGWFDTRSPIFLQRRVGLNLKSFTLFKFRTMKINTSSSGTHLVDPSNITFLGYFLRKYKLDELLQLWNVMIGNMSIVGPRPCLFNQKRLISERRKRGIFKVKPGITGLAQISGITMKTPKLLSITDHKMIQQMNLYYYFYYILKTLLSFIKK